MPRPYPPPLLSAPTAAPFNIGNSEKRDLAKVLGLDSLPPEVSDMVAHAIASYKATGAGSPDTTVKNTLAQLNELKKEGTPYRNAVRRLAMIGAAWIISLSASCNPWRWRPSETNREHEKLSPKLRVRERRNFENMSG
jgi:hypothetical protein